MCIHKSWNTSTSCCSHVVLGHNLCQTVGYHFWWHVEGSYNVLCHFMLCSDWLICTCGSWQQSHCENSMLNFWLCTIVKLVSKVLNQLLVGSKTSLWTDDHRFHHISLPIHWLSLRTAKATHGTNCVTLSRCGAHTLENNLQISKPDWNSSNHDELFLKAALSNLFKETEIKCTHVHDHQSVQSVIVPTKEQKMGRSSNKKDKQTKEQISKQKPKQNKQRKKHPFDPLIWHLDSV